MHAWIRVHYNFSLLSTFYGVYDIRLCNYFGTNFKSIYTAMGLNLMVKIKFLSILNLRIDMYLLLY